jgi:hypothetical protein
MYYSGYTYTAVHVHVLVAVVIYGGVQPCMVIIRRCTRSMQPRTRIYVATATGLRACSAALRCAGLAVDHGARATALPLPLARYTGT